MGKARLQIANLGAALNAHDFERSFVAASSLRSAIARARDSFVFGKLGADCRAQLRDAETQAEPLLAQAPEVSARAYDERMRGPVDRSRSTWDHEATAWQAKRGVPTLPESVTHALQSEQGSPLPDAATWSERVGGDVSGARLVTGAAAAGAAAAVGARAFTVGNRVFFGGGHDASTDGGGLLGHELHHVVQQQGASTPSSWGDLPVLDHGDAREVAAREHRGGEGGGGLAIARDTHKTPVSPNATPTAAGQAMAQGLPMITQRWKAVGADLFTAAEKPTKVPPVAVFETAAYSLISVDIVDLDPVDVVLKGPNRKDYFEVFHRAADQYAGDKRHFDAIQAAVTNIAAGGQVQFNATRVMAEQAALSSNGKRVLAADTSAQVRALQAYINKDAFNHGEMEDPTVDVYWTEHEGGGKPRVKACQSILRLLKTGAPPDALAAGEAKKPQPTAEATKKAGELMKAVDKVAATAKGKPLTAPQLVALQGELAKAGPDGREVAWNDKTQVSKLIQLFDPRARRCSSTRSIRSRRSTRRAMRRSAVTRATPRTRWCTAPEWWGTCPKRCRNSCARTSS